MLGLRGHQVVVLEASDAAGGQIRLASSSPRRRDLIGIIDWRLAECKHFDVDVRYNTYAEADDVLAEDPDLVVVATGGVPNTEFLTEGAQLVSDGWDVLSGAFRVKGDVLLYDDNGRAPWPGRRRGTGPREREDRIRHAGADFGSRRRWGQLPRILQGVRRTRCACHAQRAADRGAPQGRPAGSRSVQRIRARHSATHRRSGRRRARHAARTNCTSPGGGVVESRRGGSAGAARSAPARGASAIRTAAISCSAIGDAVASRNIHAAVFDAYRLCLAL